MHTARPRPRGDRTVHRSHRGPRQCWDSLYELGERLITISTDGRTGFDLGLVRDWIQFRDERNGERL